jgi:hypothetical protein
MARGMSAGLPDLSRLTTVVRLGHITWMCGGGSVSRAYRYAGTERDSSATEQLFLRKPKLVLRPSFPVPVRSYSPPSRGSEWRHVSVLRKQLIQPPADRAQPLYPTMRLAPRLLDRSHLRFRYLSRKVQLPPVTEVDASPGHLLIVVGESRG